ncbi:hypothetical protein QN277_008850 [Acacia crassicarpa]|uniref:Uncharacterized protein n=1 Tax=Acacia crassicarpa TaxID=499986 RepID=A0AAE1MAY0_9FABA|nr:hypothetical protein QN277_008850 [Acacia crassicarpa]
MACFLDIVILVYLFKSYSLQLNNLLYLNETAMDIFMVEQVAQLKEQAAQLKEQAEQISEQANMILELRQLLRSLMKDKGTGPPPDGDSDTDGDPARTAAV